MNPAASTVVAVHTVPVSLPARPELVVRGAKGSHAHSDFLLVRVVTSDGIEGYGEVSATPLWSGEDGASARHFIAGLLGPALLGRPLAPVGALESLLDRLLAGNPFTKAGLATALWDAYARTLEVPLAVALGGAYRRQVPIKISLSGDGPELERAYAAAVAAGFRAFKVKAGFEVAADVARVCLARELAGPAAVLGVDANGGWSRVRARESLRGLAAADLSYVEQPVAPEDLDGMAELRAQGPPVVADESVFGRTDLIRVIRAAAADVVSIYLGKAGGPGRAVALAALAESFGIEVVLGSNGELGLGAAAQLQVACALPALSSGIPSDIIGAHYYAEDVLEWPLDSDGALVRLGDGPGLGVRPREDLLRRFH
ncbi:mandelate racemase/muconate lactonizing enzyme family protein [Amycolatopsis aidingensis]|uniref:mandelate racemase/muconate lactonizing enzyme family protein n=1 Tax=Amycolatopsis aidingensis TaxID=2842453 RepID=UPI001C0B72D6|nr:enolase C-terminal domain-like protein [Amycolatopsis aidingensis]